MIKFLNEFTLPTVSMDYFEYFEGAIDYRGEFNGFEIHEEFSEYDEFKNHNSLLRDKILDHIDIIKSYDELVNARDLFLLIKSKYKDTKEGIVHNSINYIQTGIEDCFKTKNTSWKAFSPKEISKFLECQYESIIFIVNHLDVLMSQKRNPTKEETKENVIKFKEGELKKIYPLFKYYFSNQDYEDLFRLLQNKNIGEKLHFKGEANKLVDAFRRLHANKVLLTNKTSIVSWIVENFTFGNNDKKHFKRESVNNLISKKDLPLKCKKPIVDFKDIYPYTEGSFN